MNALTLFQVVNNFLFVQLMIFVVQMEVVVHPHFYVPLKLYVLPILLYFVMMVHVKLQLPTVLHLLHALNLLRDVQMEIVLLVLIMIAHKQFIAPRILLAHPLLLYYVGIMHV